MVKKLPINCMFVQNITPITNITNPPAGFTPPDDGFIDFFFHISTSAVTVDWQVEAQAQRILAIMGATDLPHTFRVPVAKNVKLVFRKANATGTIDIGSAVYFRR